MSTRNLDAIFHPKRIAVIGASDKVGSVGYTVLRNLIGSGFEGVVYPVNPKRESVQGIAAYTNIAALPKAPDLAVICIPAPLVPGTIRECGEAGVDGVIILSAGFGEVGGEGKVLQQTLMNTVADFYGMRIIGPNCLGLISPGAHLNASFAAGMPRPGHVAFISQSGALCTSVLDWAMQKGVGFSHFVSIGNMVDVNFADLIDYFAEDDQTQSIILYIESMNQARSFMSAARARTRTKPIIAYKAGRFAESAGAASSHTGALAGSHEVFEAGFERAGIVPVYDIAHMFDCAELLSHHTPPKGPSLAIVTNGGGPGVMAVDTLIANGGKLAELSDQTVEKLNQVLPPCWSHGNPVDVLGDAGPDRFAKAVEIILDGPNVDTVLVILTPQAMTDATGTAEALIRATTNAKKPVIAAWMGGAIVAEAKQLLSRAGIPNYHTPEQAVRAVMQLVSYASNLEMLYETPREVPIDFPIERDVQRTHCMNILSQGDDVLSEADAKQLLHAYGIPVSFPEPAESADEAVAIADRIGYPIVMKILSPQITHKTDVGGVALNLRNAQSVRDEYEKMTNTAAEKRPDATIHGVTVQPMINRSGGQELILGARKDPIFGAVVMVGAGGVTAEIMRDSALGLPPLNEHLAMRMLKSLRIWPLLQGYRGQKGADIDKLVETIIRLSYLVADYPQISELDINPLLAGPEQVIALDARVMVDQEAVEQKSRPFSHLSIRPYPEQYMKNIKLPDGTSVLLRPIKPEDEPMWHEMLGECSMESIRYRFFGVFKQTTHKMATRYCFIDYDRELAIVAEIQDGDKRKLIGVGRLVADANHEDAEYAIIIADPWQQKWIGTAVTEYCEEIAQQWGVKRIKACTLPDNHRMINLFEQAGYNIKRSEDLVQITKELDAETAGAGASEGAAG